VVSGAAAQADPDPDTTFSWERNLALFLLTGLFLIALFHTLHLAAELFLPLALAFLFNFLLSPLVRILKGIHIPESLGAALVMLVLLGAVGGGLSLLADPAADWIARAPQSMTRIQAKLTALRRPVDQIGRTADQVEKSLGGNPAAASAPEAKQPWFKGAIFLGTQAFLGGTIIVIVLLYFLLASGDMFLRKLVRALHSRKDKERAIKISREMESQISGYLVTVTLINLGVGFCVGVGVWLLGMPNPALWGVLAGVLTYVPYLGAILGIAILTVASLLTFDTLGHAFAVPAVYVFVSFIEGNFVTPHVVGKRLSLNPVAIFIGLIVWSFLWGVPGMLLAVPILATCKIVCDHVELLSPLGEFLGPAEGE
jgi:predicted PurR-regulated permease PerM